MTDIARTHVNGAGNFVGRDSELSALLAGLEQARSGRGSVFLIGGEPGIGKSRLADELSGRARNVGAGVLWGKCWEGGGAPAYWPWVQCFRGYLRAHDPASIRRHLGPGAADIAQILPEISNLFPEVTARPAADSESARFRLFDSTATFLRNAAADDVLVVVIDDLQVADTPSLLLLRFLASQVADAGVVVVATYRDVEITPDHALTTLIAEMAREPTTHHLQLRGLTRDDVARLAQGSVGTAPMPALVLELHRQTNGNPLFIGEAIKLLASEGRFDDAASVRFTIPGAVRDVITRRLGHLSERCRATLRMAAVLGPEMAAEALRRLADVSYDELLEIVDEAITSGLLVEAGGALGRYRFSHDLIREALYDEISTPQRVRLHLRAGQTLEAIYASDLDRHLAEIAHHLFKATPAADPAKARSYASRAAEHAARQLAYEEAVRLYQLALQAMELDDEVDETARCELLLDLGDAQMRAGETPRAKETFLGAAAIARRLSTPEHLARAALGYGGRFVWARAANDRNVIPLLEDALAMLGGANTVLRARVLARLAGALRDQPQASTREALSRKAVEIARSLDDPSALAYALDGRYSAIWAPDTIDERMRIADEIVAIAKATGDVERAFQGYHYRLAVFLERGDIPAVRAQLDHNSRLADELRQPPQRWYVRASVAILSLLEGRFGDAEAFIAEAFDHGRHAESVHALGVARLQQYALRREQGRASELEEPLRSLLDEYAFWPWMRCVLLHLYAELDRRADARSLLESIAGQNDFGDLPWDNDWLLGMSLLADVVAYLNDSRRAGALYELLGPYWDRNGYGHPEFCTGSISRPLGVLAGVLGRWDDAERHFADAIVMNQRMGASPWLAYAWHDYAAMLLARDGPDDRAKADQLLADALDLARELGMAALEQKVRKLSDETQPQLTSPAATTAAVFRREGEYWTISFGGQSFRLRDAKGLHYLARLLAEPGREILALDLVQEAGAGPEAERGVAGADLTTGGLGDAGAHLDPQAKAAYGERLRELRQEHAEAERFNDPERAARAQEEIDFLARELARAVGLGGRDRTAGSATERARVSVTRAIRGAMARIARHNPGLGDHLATTIHTGTYCAYRPDARVPIRWEL